MNRKSKSGIGLISGRDMGGRATSFYPPRARWYSPWLLRGHRFRRRIRLGTWHWPDGLSPIAVLVSLVVPGAGFCFRAARLWGTLALVLSGALGLMVIGWFGYEAGSMAFGSLLTLHASGVAFLIDPLLIGSGFRTRLLYGAGIFIALLCLLYLPGRDFVQNHWFLPLRVNGQIIVINRTHPPVAWHRGDRVAYTFGSDSAHQLIIRGGVALGAVLAVPGDQVVFSESEFAVNGISKPRLTLMPSQGAFTVPENHWFVWADLDISGHGNVPTAYISEALLRLNKISEDQFVGRPPRRWLWRKQF